MEEENGRVHLLLYLTGGSAALVEIVVGATDLYVLQRREGERETVIVIKR